MLKTFITNTFIGTNGIFTNGMFITIIQGTVSTFVNIFTGVVVDKIICVTFDICFSLKSFGSLMETRFTFTFITSLGIDTGSLFVARIHILVYTFIDISTRICYLSRFLFKARFALAFK